VLAGARELLNTDEDISEAVNSIETEFRRFWGAACLVDSACLQPVAFCSKTEGSLSGALGLSLDGECRPMWWMWLALAGLALLLIGGCICCIW